MCAYRELRTFCHPPKRFAHYKIVQTAKSDGLKSRTEGEYDVQEAKRLDSETSKLGAKLPDATNYVSISVLCCRLQLPPLPPPLYLKDAVHTSFSKTLVRRHAVYETTLKCHF